MKQPSLVSVGSILALHIAGGVVGAAENIDPTDSGEQYAWCENTGWLNAEPGGNGGPGVLVADDGLSGFMWSESTGWVIAAETRVAPFALRASAASVRVPAVSTMSSTITAAQPFTSPMIRISST